MRTCLTVAVGALILGLSAPAAFAQNYGGSADAAAGAPSGGLDGRPGLANSLRERQHGMAPVYSDDDLTTGSTSLPREGFGERRTAPNRWRGIHPPADSSTEVGGCVVPNFGMVI